MKRVTLLVLMIASLVGCGTSAATVTIDRGIYGDVVYTSDLDPTDGPLKDQLVELLARDAMSTDPALATARTDDNGFFEIAYDGGDYDICLRNDGGSRFNCSGVAIGSEPIRCDASSGAEGHWWDCEPDR